MSSPVRRRSLAVLLPLALAATACTSRGNDSAPDPEPPVAESPTSDSIASDSTGIELGGGDSESTSTGEPTTSAEQDDAPATTDTSTTATSTTDNSSTATDTTAPSDAIRLDAGDHRFLFEFDGRDRSYRVHVPDELDPDPAILLALHGGGGTGEQFQDENEMDVVADREGFIVVYPEGTGLLPNRLHTWNSGFNCCGYSLDNNVDDVGFLRLVVDDLETRQTFDRGRVYATGHSNGAMMSYRLAAEASDLVAAIVPVAGALSVMDPALSQPVPMLHIHSLDDPRALYDGGQGPPFPGTERTHIAEPVLPGIETWAELNECEEASSIAETIEDGSETAETIVWDCPDGADVEHLRLSGSGHGWPGVEVGPLIQRLLGPPTNVIEASEEIWAFVSQFDRTP